MSEKNELYTIIFQSESGAEASAHVFGEGVSSVRAYNDAATSVRVHGGTALLTAARDAGIAIDAPCGGNGSCGKCKVRLVSGELESTRGRHISEDDYAAGYRLACESVVCADAEIFVPESATAWQSRIRVDEIGRAEGSARNRAKDGADGIASGRPDGGGIASGRPDGGGIANNNNNENEASFGTGSDAGRGANRPSDRIRRSFAGAGFTPDNQIECVKIELHEPSLDDAEADRERLLRASKTEKITLFALRKLPGILRECGFSPYCLIEWNGDGRSNDRRYDSRGGEFNDVRGAQRDGGFDAGHGIERNNRCDEERGGGTIIDVSGVPIRPVGVAVDIGTTTVSALLVDLSTGEVLGAGSAGNGQIRYGADVINRLIESAKPGGAERLRRAITEDCLVPLIEGICKSTGVPTRSIARAAISGNTTMIHLLLDVYGNNLRMEPYVPAFFAVDELRGADLGIGINPDAEAFIAPSVGSYVGGDITAGTLAAGISGKADPSLFIDLGTNGEIVLAGDGFLMSCACSAGPSFEGGDISCGMRATDGAIESVTISEDTMEASFGVVEGTSPVGICGSGLIDLISELFRCGIIDARGKIIRESERTGSDDWGGKYYVVSAGVSSAAGANASGNDTDMMIAADNSTDGTSNSADERGRDIVITETDIDNFIRAKGSVYSAIRTMLSITGMTENDIEHVYIAGGIGSAIDIGNAIRTGMLPALPELRYEYIGNTSLSGAYQILLSEEARMRIKVIKNSMTYIELSAYAGYMDEFIAACFLPHTDASLFPGADK